MPTSWALGSTSPALLQTRHHFRNGAGLGPCEGPPNLIPLAVPRRVCFGHATKLATAEAYRALSEPPVLGSLTCRPLRRQ
jgi:hypothetical protein